MKNDNLVQHPASEEQHNDIMSHSDDIQVSSEMISCDKIDLYSSDFIKLSNYELETLFGALPSLALAGLTSNTINELGKMQLYTLTKNGISISQMN